MAKNKKTLKAKKKRKIKDNFSMNNIEKGYRRFYSQEVTNKLTELRKKVVDLTKNHTKVDTIKDNYGIVTLNAEIDNEVRYLENLKQIINKSTMDNLRYKIIPMIDACDSTLWKISEQRKEFLKGLYGRRLDYLHFLVVVAKNKDGKLKKQINKINANHYLKEPEIIGLLKRLEDKAQYLPKGYDVPVVAINRIIYYLDGKPKEFVVEDYRVKSLGRFGEKTSEFIQGLRPKLSSDLGAFRVRGSYNLIHKIVKNIGKISDPGAFYPEYIIFNKSDSNANLLKKIKEAKRLSRKYEAWKPEDIPNDDREKMIPRVEVDFFYNKYPIQAMVQDFDSGNIYEEGVISHENFYYSFRGLKRAKKIGEIKGLNAAAEHIDECVEYLLGIN